MEKEFEKDFEDIGEFRLGENIFGGKEPDLVASPYIQKARCKKCGEEIEYFLRSGAYSFNMGAPEQRLYDHLLKHKIK